MYFFKLITRIGYLLNKLLCKCIEVNILPKWGAWKTPIKWAFLSLQNYWHNSLKKTQESGIFNLNIMLEPSHHVGERERAVWKMPKHWAFLTWISCPTYPIMQQVEQCKKCPVSGHFYWVPSSIFILSVTLIVVLLFSLCGLALLNEFENSFSPQSWFHFFFYLLYLKVIFPTKLVPRNFLVP